MTIVNSLRAALAASVCLLPLSALAQSGSAGSSNSPAASQSSGDNWITLGAQYQTARSPFFGRYNGQEKRGFYGIGAFNLQGRDAWDSGGTGYWGFQGADLGLDTRSLSIRGGQQGSWGVNIFYDSIPYWYSDTMRSVWNQNGALVPGVARGSVANATTLEPRLWGLDQRTKRDILGATGKYRWNDWIVNVGMRHEHKEGYKENALIWGSAPVSPSLANISTGAWGTFGEPISYDTDRYDVAAEFNQPNYQVLVAYTFHHFQDNKNSIYLASPFALTSGFGGAATNVAAVYSLPPSNSAHQARIEAGVNFTETTRLNVNFEYGLAAQNDTFPAGTANTNLVSFGMPKSGLDGAIQSIYGNVVLTSRPISKLDLRLSYTLDKRDNLTSRFSFLGYTGDTSTFEDSWNLPLSYQSQVIKAEAGYRLAPETKLTATYSFEDIHRNYGDTTDMTEHSAAVKLRSAITEGLYGAVSYLHGDRSTGAYNKNAFVIASANDPTATVDFTGFMKFYESSRVRDEIKGTLDFSPTRNLSAMLSAKFRNDQYPSSQLGLRSNYNLSIGPDIGWEINKGLSLHGYYMFERYYYEQNAVYWSPTGVCNSDGATQTAACNGKWTGKTTDDSHTAGVTLEWQAIPNLLKLSADYTFNYGNSAYSIADGGLLALGGVAQTSLVVAPGPNVSTTLHALTLRGEYKIRPNLSLLGGYTFATFSDNDYVFNQTAAQYTNALFSGDAKPDYTVHVVMLALRARF